MNIILWKSLGAPVTDKIRYIHMLAWAIDILKEGRTQSNENNFRNKWIWCQERARLRMDCVKDDKSINNGVTAKMMVVRRILKKKTSLISHTRAE